MKTMVIINPSAGKGKTLRHQSKVRRELERFKIIADFRIAQRKGEIKKITAESLERGYKRIILCGGDGTIHEAIPELINTEVILCIIPLGTGNDLSRSLGIKEDIVYACSVIANGIEKKIDIVRVNQEHYYVGVGALGFDAEVAALAERIRKYAPVILVYILAILLKLITYSFKKVKICFDHKEFEDEVLLIAFANSRFYGKGIQITPSGKIDDGILDICMIKRLNKLRLLTLLPIAYEGKHINFSETKLYQAKKIYVESPQPLFFYGDGEFICYTPLYIETVPQVLRVMVPQGIDFIERSLI